MLGLDKPIGPAGFVYKRLIYSKGRVTHRKIEVFYRPVHSLNGHNSQGWARQKPGTRTFFRISHVDAGAQTVGPSSVAFQSTLAGSWIGNGPTGTQFVPQYGMLAL